MIEQQERQEFEKKASRAAQLSVKMRILFFAEHCERCGTVDVS